jgi:ABC-type glycerol-3-phosphate transport system permease component
MFLLKQYMESLPEAVLDAARVDGAGEWTTFWRVVLPMAMPPIGVLWILIFLQKWNDYLWPMVMIRSQELLPIMVLLPTLSLEDSVWSIPWELVLAGCVIVTLPIIIAFFMFQDKFMSSVTIGAVKE